MWRGVEHFSQPSRWALARLWWSHFCWPLRGYYFPSLDSGVLRVFQTRRDLRQDLGACFSYKGCPHGRRVSPTFRTESQVSRYAGCKYGDSGATPTHRALQLLALWLAASAMFTELITERWWPACRDLLPMDLLGLTELRFVGSSGPAKIGRERERETERAAVKL